MLDWEENAFVGLKALWRRLFVTPKERKTASVQALLGDHRQELFLLAHLVSGREVKLFETEEPLLWRDDYVLLPPRMIAGRSPEANVDLYRLRTVVGALALRENWFRDNGGIADLLLRHHDDYSSLAGKLDQSRAKLREGNALSDILGELPAKPGKVRFQDGDAGNLTEHNMLQPEGEGDAETAELEGKGRIEVEVVESREDFGTGSEMPEHVFEKVETLEEYDGQSRKSEADEDLPDHKEALDELNMNKVMRSTERPRTIYRADLMIDAMAFEIGDEAPGNGVPYPEWNYRRKRYRPDWCFVKEYFPREGDLVWAKQTQGVHRRLIRQLQRQFATISSDWLRVRRQTYGPEFDIDALIRAEVDRRSGWPATEAIYQDRKRDVQDSAVLLLLDQSYSTDSWLDNARVLDTIRETIFCCSEVLSDYVECFAIAGFSSNTRCDCRFNWLKGFRESWDQVRGRLGMIEATGYTRIGPALRHAQEILADIPARRKVVILVTDGRPCDYDRYEGEYGVHDVKKAIETGKREGIQTHAYAIEKRAAEYFPKMFTRDHYDIIPNPDQLAGNLCGLFMRLNC